MISVYTSIPAVGILRNASCVSGVPIDILRYVIQSWHAAGLDPVSVNTLAEVNANTRFRKKLNDLGVKLVLADSTVKAGFPRHLPNFKHLVEIASIGKSSDWICICNSDILLADPSALVTCINNLTSQSFGIGQRTDVRSLDSVKGENFFHSNAPYRHGFDFFIISKAQLLLIAPMIDLSLTFGLPWWDLILPVLLSTLGCQPCLLNHSFFAHVIHDARQWNWHYWNYIGFSSIMDISMRLRKSPSSSISSQLAPFFDISHCQYIKYRLKLSLGGLPGLSRYSSVSRFPQLEVASNQITQLLLK